MNPVLEEVVDSMTRISRTAIAGWVVAAGLGLVALGVTGCGAPAPDAQARAEALRTLMNEALDPAADGIWDKAGYIDTEAGTQELWPTDAAGWAEVGAAADRIDALAQQLAAPPYANGEADWAEIALGMRDAAGAAKAAALAQDKEGLFEAGGHLYRVCASCHARYAVGVGARPE